MGALNILLADAARRWADRTADRLERRRRAAAELPAGRMARTVHWTSQATAIAVTLAELLAAIATIRHAANELRQPLNKGMIE